MWRHSWNLSRPSTVYFTSEFRAPVSTYTVHHKSPGPTVMNHFHPYKPVTWFPFVYIAAVLTDGQTDTRTDYNHRLTNKTWRTSKIRIISASVSGFVPLTCRTDATYLLLQVVPRRNQQTSTCRGRYRLWTGIGRTGTGRIRAVRTPGQRL